MRQKVKHCLSSLITLSVAISLVVLNFTYTGRDENFFVRFLFVFFFQLCHFYSIRVQTCVHFSRKVSSTLSSNYQREMNCYVVCALPSFSWVLILSAVSLVIASLFRPSKWWEMKAAPLSVSTRSEGESGQKTVKETNCALGFTVHLLTSCYYRSNEMDIHHWITHFSFSSMALLYVYHWDHHVCHVVCGTIYSPIDRLTNSLSSFNLLDIGVK